MKVNELNAILTNLPPSMREYPVYIDVCDRRSTPATEPLCGLVDVDEVAIDVVDGCVMIRYMPWD